MEIGNDLLINSMVVVVETSKTGSLTTEEVIERKRKGDSISKDRHRTSVKTGKVGNLSKPFYANKDGGYLDTSDVICR